MSIGHTKTLFKTSTKGTIGPGRRRLLIYSPIIYVITVSPACAYTLHQLDAASRVQLQPHWLQQASVVLVKVQCQVLNR